MKPLRLLSLTPLLGLACSAAAPGPAPAPPGSSIPELPPPSSPAAASSAGAASSAEAASSAAASSSAPPPPAAKPPCPEGMAHVDGTYCPTVERVCLQKEENKANHITLCHEFKRGSTRCTSPEERREFCIDRYEYPNREGGHPAWMVSWHDAEATCRHQGKRLCYESEWVTACEGPEHTPFPYGWARDQTACNIDNTWINPHLDQMYSSDPARRDPELARLDQSVASGAMPRCVSGYGVHDLTGNMDEWVTRDSRASAKDKSKWAGLKGGAWGHVRNACRPMTTSHAPEFTYYFVSFRCCADVEGKPPYAPTAGPKAPRVTPSDRAPEPQPKDRVGPSKHKVKRGG